MLDIHSQANSNLKWEPASNTYRVGSMTINRIVDIENVPFPADVIYPNARHHIIIKLREN